MMMRMRVSRVFLLYVSLLSKRRNNRNTVTYCASIAGNVVPNTGDQLHLLSTHGNRLAYETPTICRLSH